MSYASPSAASLDFAGVGSYTAPDGGALDFSVGATTGPTIPTRAGLDVSHGAPWGQGHHLDRRRRLPWGAYGTVDRPIRVRPVPMSRRERAIAALWDALRVREAQAAARWAETAAPTAAQVAAPWVDLRPRDARGAVAWDRSIRPRPAHATAPWIVPGARDFHRRQPYDHADRYRVEGERPPPYSPPAPDGVSFAAPTETPPAPDAVAFRWGQPEPNRRIGPRGGRAPAQWRGRVPRRDEADRIPWGPRGARDSVGIDIDYDQEPPEPAPDPPPLPPELEVYALMPSITATRVSDGEAINVNAASVTTDRDSFCWQLDATLARAEDLALVMPGAGGPVLIDVTVNGRTWRFLVESYRRQRSYNSSTYQIRGRGQAATLTAPYATPRTRTESTQRTAQQLALDELEFSGWTLVWEAEDWTVPAGVYSYQELTPLQSIQRIAEAVGAVVHSHPTDQTLTVAPRYPTSPWLWSGATPDVILPDYLMTSLSLDWSPGPPYNAVYVAGRQQGVLVHVLRGGTSQDQEAPMVVDPLIVTRLAGRERGRQILAGAGDRARVPIVTPLLPDPEPPGLVLPGQLVEVQEGGETWIGQAAGVTVAAGRQNATTVRQTVEVERWYG